MAAMHPSSYMDDGLCPSPCLSATKAILERMLAQELKGLEQNNITVASMPKL